MAGIFDTKLLSCGLGGRPGKDGKCKKPMKKGPRTSPLTVFTGKPRKSRYKI